MIRRVIIVHGDVQESAYRSRIVSIAKKMGITGTVQNLLDGEVKIIAEGDKGSIDWFCDEINVRNFLIKVARIQILKEITIEEREYESFGKIVGEDETDKRLDRAAEILKGLAESQELALVEQREYIKEQREYNKKIDGYNSRLEKILEKLTEK